MYLSLCWSTGYNDDLFCDLLLLQPDGFLDGDLIEGVHGVFDPVRDDAQLVGPDSDLDGIVDASLAANQNTHFVVAGNKY